MYYSEQLIEQYSKPLSDSENKVAKVPLGFSKLYFQNMAFL